MCAVKCTVAASSFFRLSPEREREWEKSERNTAAGTWAFATLRIGAGDHSRFYTELTLSYLFCLDPLLRIQIFYGYQMKLRAVIRSKKGTHPNPLSTLSLFSPRSNRRPFLLDGSGVRLQVSKGRFCTFTTRARPLARSSVPSHDGCTAAPPPRRWNKSEDSGRSCSADGREEDRERETEGNGSGTCCLLGTLFRAAQPLCNCRETARETDGGNASKSRTWQGT